MLWKNVLISIILSLSTLLVEGCPDTVEVSCPCGKAEPKKYITTSVKVYRYLSKKFKKEHCRTSHKDVFSACARLRNCVEEPIVVDNSTRIKRRSGEMNFIIEEMNRPDNSPIIFRYPANRHIRKERSVDVFDPILPGQEFMQTAMKDGGEDYEDDDEAACELYSDLESAHVKCSMYTKYIICVETCLSGFELDDGNTTRKTKCYYKNPAIWVPKPLDECRRVRNCEVKMISPGSLNCEFDTIEYPICYIHCLPYDHHEYSPLREYECKGNGSYDPPLPHCVQIDHAHAVVRR